MPEYVCHFEDDFIIQKKKATRLAEGAIPTLNLHPILDELAKKTSTDDDTFLSLVVPPKRMKMSTDACTDDDKGQKSLDTPSGSQSISETVYKPALTDAPHRRKLKMQLLEDEKFTKMTTTDTMPQSKLRLSKKKNRRAKRYYNNSTRSITD
ncbi:hypothetical protein EVAR_10988_1 [Eumeta japonica]|uniref:Uncharacterized protein n=1 Tax=Eumeta variegata TaxID=151549 RepID=A0A4C1U680_EUMVA|nr:hypothetical protein EVAR_10988_1 [Eumeta japonica]